jgi:hypothetical protein
MGEIYDLDPLRRMPKTVKGVVRATTYSSAFTGENSFGRIQKPLQRGDQ